MRTFVREKKIYCGENYLEVDIYNYTATEQENARRGRRSKKEIESTPKQVDWNDRNSKRRFLQLVNTNFDENDIHFSCTYSKDNMPSTCADAERELRNFLRRVEYARKKEGLPPLKYISIPACTYKKDGVTPARIHHHVIMNGGLSRDEIEDLWRKRRRKGQKKGDKIGFANADRLQPGEYGFAALCEYLAKQGGGKKRWSTSQNLDKPEKEITDPDSPPKSEPCKYSASANLQKPWSRTNNHSYSRKEVMKIAKSPPPPEYWRKRYPGYEIISGENGFQAVYTEPRGWCLYLKFRRIKQ